MNTVANTPDCLGGWCRVGSIVTSDFYMEEAGEPRRVIKIAAYGDHDGRVWTEMAQGLRALDGVDFKTWIKQPPQ